MTTASAPGPPRGRSSQLRHQPRPPPRPGGERPRAGGERRGRGHRRESDRGPSGWDLHLRLRRQQLQAQHHPEQHDQGPTRTDSCSFHDNLIAGNRILGAEGVALVLQRGSGNRIVGNVIQDVSRREPFPGNTVASGSELRREENGSGIWVSPGSEKNPARPGRVSRPLQRRPGLLLRGSAGPQR